MAIIAQELEQQILDALAEGEDQSKADLAKRIPDMSRPRTSPRRCARSSAGAALS